MPRCCRPTAGATWRRCWLTTAPKRAWPTDRHEQIKAVAEVLAGAKVPLAVPELEARFSACGRWRERLHTILSTLEALGRARPVPQADTVHWQGV